MWKDIADNEKQIKVAKMEVSLNDLAGKSYSLTSSLALQLINEVEDIKEDLDDREVLTNFYRVRSAEVLVEANSLAGRKI